MSMWIVELELDLDGDVDKKMMHIVKLSSKRVSRGNGDRESGIEREKERIIILRRHNQERLSHSVSL